MMITKTEICSLVDQRKLLTDLRNSLLSDAIEFLCEDNEEVEIQIHEDSESMFFDFRVSLIWSIIILICVFYLNYFLVFVSTKC